MKTTESVLKNFLTDTTTQLVKKHLRAKFLTLPTALLIILIALAWGVVFYAEYITPDEPSVNGSTQLIKVERVIDGDTVELQGIGKARLIGIDTPELKGRDGKIECYAYEAQQYLAKLVEGAEVYIEYDNTQGKVDRYGRSLIYLYKSDDVLINELLIAQGYAKEYTYSKEYLYAENFKDAEQNAQSLKLGIWGNCK